MAADTPKIDLLKDLLNQPKEGGKKRKKVEGPVRTTTPLVVTILHSPHSQPPEPVKKKQKEAAASTPSELPLSEPTPTEGSNSEVWRPEFVHPITGAPVLLSDSVRKTPELGLAILSGSTLPADATFPKGLASKFHAAMALMVRAGQSMVDTYGGMVAADQKFRATLAEQKKMCLEKDEDVEKLKGQVKDVEGQLKAKEAEVKEVVAEKREFAAELVRQKAQERKAGLEDALAEFRPQVVKALEYGRTEGMKKGYNSGYLAALTLANHPSDSGI